MSLHLQSSPSGLCSITDMNLDRHVRIALHQRNSTNSMPFFRVCWEPQNTSITKCKHRPETRYPMDTAGLFLIPFPSCTRDSIFESERSDLLDFCISGTCSAFPGLPPVT